MAAASDPGACGGPGAQCLRMVASRLWTGLVGQEPAFDLRKLRWAATVLAAAATAGWIIGVGGFVGGGATDATVWISFSASLLFHLAAIAFFVHVLFFRLRMSLMEYLVSTAVFGTLLGLGLSNLLRGDVDATRAALAALYVAVVWAGMMQGLAWSLAAAELLRVRSIWVRLALHAAGWVFPVALISLGVGLVLATAPWTTSSSWSDDETIRWGAEAFVAGSLAATPWFVVEFRARRAARRILAGTG